jgi:poly-gamma-glutamate capsule biosynthesis protein CapA/YwtB (metallophosphatase superfamily)
MKADAKLMERNRDQRMLDRRRVLARLCAGPLATALAGVPARAGSARREMLGGSANSDGAGQVLKLFLCGDVMVGRGVDQILPHPCEPQIYEPYLRDARDYVALAEKINGPIARPVPYPYIWGDALAELERMAPDVRIVNLETAITSHDRFWPKGINYRMHPRNIAALTVARIDCCAMANNHVLDWGAQGLAETLGTLASAGIHTAGAGGNLEQAQSPAVIPMPGSGRVLVFAFGERYSGIARDWVATPSRPGIDLLPDLSRATVDEIADRVAGARKPGDTVVASIHWGGNWGYEIPAAQRDFAHGLIEHAGIDIVHGHSSHHFKGIEVYRERLILYGCGDFLNDYEGILSNAEYRSELGLMFFPTLEAASGRLLRLILLPTRIRRMQIQRARPHEVAWQVEVLNREGRALGTRVKPYGEGGLLLDWRG